MVEPYSQDQGKQREVFVSMKDGPEGQTGYLATIPAGAKVSFSKGRDGELEMIPEPDTEPPTLKPMNAKDYQGNAHEAQTVDLRRASKPDDNVYLDYSKPGGLLSAWESGEAKLRQGITPITDIEATAALPDHAPQKQDPKLGSPS